MIDYLYLPVALVLILYYYSPVIIARFFSLKKGERVPPSTEILEEALQGKPLLIYFSNPEVKICRKMDPHVKEVARQGYKILKIDASRRSKVLEDYKIRTVPTSIFVKEGVVREVVVGVLKKEKLKEKLEAIK